MKKYCVNFPRFVIMFNYLLVCTGLILVSCSKSPELSVFPKEIIFDAYLVEEQTIDISANVAWTVETLPRTTWFTIEPMQGRGNATITVAAVENYAFTGRNARIIISGQGTQTDTIRVVQTAGVDVADIIDDTVFLQFCIDKYDTKPKDGKLSMEEILGVIRMEDIKKQGITSLAGIEYFRNLRFLDCSNNLLESLDVSANKALTTLNCSGNYWLTDINVTGNEELLTLDCSYTAITNIDVSTNIKLTELVLFSLGPNQDQSGQEKLSHIDVRNNTALRKLVVSNNQIEELDVSNNPDLKHLFCNENRLHELALTANANLTTLYCGNNRLETLDVSKNTLLDSLYCNDNKLKELLLNQNPALVYLSCARNIEITKLDVTKNVRLKNLESNNNDIDGVVNLVQNRGLEKFNFKSNPRLNTIVIWSGFVPNSSDHQIDSPPTSYQYQ